MSTNPSDLAAAVADAACQLVQSPVPIYEVTFVDVHAEGVPAEGVDLHCEANVRTALKRPLVRVYPEVDTAYAHHPHADDAPVCMRKLDVQVPQLLNLAYNDYVVTHASMYSLFKQMERGYLTQSVFDLVYDKNDPKGVRRKPLTTRAGEHAFNDDDADACVPPLPSLYRRYCYRCNHEYLLFEIKRVA